MTTAPSTAPILWRLRLNAPPDRVLTAWMDPDQHVHFWCERSAATAEGFRLHFIDGTVTECAVEGSGPGHRVVFRYFGSRVEILAEANAGGTDLTLRASDVTPDDWHDTHAGWVSVLLAFKTYIDHGLDLRSHDPARTWVQRFVDQ